MQLNITVGFVESYDKDISLSPARHGQWLGLWSDVIKTTLEYDKMIEGNVSQDDYLRVSPALTTIIPHSNVLPSVLKPIFFNKNRFSRSVPKYSHYWCSPTAILACKNPPSVEPAVVS